MREDWRGARISLAVLFSDDPYSSVNVYCRLGSSATLKPVLRTIGVLALLGAALLSHAAQRATTKSAQTMMRSEPTPAPHSLDGQMIIWSGGRTKGEAQSQLEGFKRYAAALKDFIDVTPVLVESATVEGLKPGFFVVALGVCNDDAASFPLKLFQAIEPAVYTRQVHYKDAAEAPQCPAPVQIASDGNDAPVYWELGEPQRSVAGGATLVALPFSYNWQEQGDFAREYFEVRMQLLLAGANRVLLDSQQYPSPSDAARLKSATVSGSSIDWELDYADPPCSPSGDRFVAWFRSFSAVAKAGKIAVVKAAPRRTKSGGCGYAEEKEMVGGRKKPH